VNDWETILTHSYTKSKITCVFKVVLKVLYSFCFDRVAKIVIPALLLFYFDIFLEIYLGAYYQFLDKYLTVYYPHPLLLGSRLPTKRRYLGKHPSFLPGLIPSQLNNSFLPGNPNPIYISENSCEIRDIFDLTLSLLIK